MIFQTFNGYALSQFKKLEKPVGLEARDETIEDSWMIEGLEMDIVSHDVRKFFKLLLKKNGYVLEQLYSPLIVHATSEHAELKAIARGCITRHHSHHYFGFAETQWKLFLNESPRRVKPLHYVYRLLLTGIWLMRTGEIEATSSRSTKHSGWAFSPSSSPANSAVPNNRHSPTPASPFTKPNINGCVANSKPRTTPASSSILRRPRPPRRSTICWCARAWGGR